MLERLNMASPRDDSRRRAVRLGRARPGGPRPSADLYRPGDLPRGDDPHLRRGVGLSRRTRARSRTMTISSRPSWGCARSSCCATRTARSARCSTAAPIAAPRCAARRRALPVSSTARITAGASSIPASCAPCRGRTAMPATSRTRNSTSRRCRASTAIAASSSARSIPMRRRCSIISAPSRGRSTNGSTASPAARSRSARRTGCKYKGNWKLAYDNSGDGYHVVFSHRSLLEMENRLADEANKGMSYYKGSPGYATDVHGLYGPRSSLQGQAAEHREARRRLVGGRRPASRHGALRSRSCAGATAAGRKTILDLASSEPVNINVFPNFSLLGNHIQVFEPVSVDETNVTWYGTAVVDEDGVLGGAVDEINALRMRTQEQFPNFGEVDDLANFEEIQRGLACLEDEWVYMHRGLGIPGPRQDRRERHHHGARHRRSVHARIHPRMETADEG